MEKKEFMDRVGKLAQENVSKGLGGPFGCVVVKDGKVVAEGVNLVTSTNDPTAHAEVTAIRNACKALGNFQLDGCEIYTSCEPCPMCLGAIYWARPKIVYYGNTQHDAQDIGFDDQFIYEEIPKKYEDRKIPFEHMPNDESSLSFKMWADKTDKIE